MTVSAVEPLAGAPTGNSAISHVVLIVVDGMMPEYLGLGSYPNLQRLLTAGTSFERAWVGQMINNTPVSHTTLVSGTLPRRHGVVYFYWRDPRTNKLLQFMSPPMIEGGAFAGLMRETGLPSLNRTLKQHRPGARVASVGSTKDFAAVAMGLDVADHVGFAVRLPADPAQKNVDQRAVSPRGDVLPESGKKGTADAPTVRREVVPPTRSLVPGGSAAAPLPEAVQCDPKYALTARELGDNDIFAGNLAVGLFEQVKPELLLVNLPDTDQVGHLTGGHAINPAAVARVMARADEQVGRLIDAYQRAGLFDRTLWILTSDHGMTPNGVNIAPSVVEGTLAEGGFQTLGGDTVHYWLKNPAEAPRAAAALDRQKAPGFYGTYFKVDEGGGKLAYQPTATLAAALDGRQRAALDYLLETVAGTQSPELVLIVGENVHVHNAPLNTIGAHSEPTWLLQKIPLAFSGPGVRPGFVSPFPARLVDIAPTILALLGLPAEGMDGVVLRDVLAAAGPAERDEQNAGPDARRLLRHQEALGQLTTR